MLVALQREYGRFITSGGQLLLAGVATQVGTPLARAVCGGVIAVVSMVAWMSTYRRARAMDEMPTSKIASTAQGYAEIAGRGRALAGLQVVSPVSQRTCLWYRYTVYVRGSDNKWRHEASEESDDSFILDDGSGECLVDLGGAEILPERKETWGTGDRRYTQWLLLEGDPIHVLGEFHTRGAVDLNLDRDEDVKALLAEWKADRARLLKRFDRDGNGEIDMREWELARAQARQEVESQHLEARRLADVNIMRRPADGRLFLVSSLAPAKLARRYRWWTLAHLIIFFCALGGTAFLLERPG